MLFLNSTLTLIFLTFLSYSHSYEQFTSITHRLQSENHVLNVHPITDESVIYYKSMQPSQFYSLHFEIVLTSETWLYLNTMIRELNKNVVEINHHFHDICYDFVSGDAILLNEYDILSDISKKKYNTQQQNVNTVMKYNNPFYGVSTTMAMDIVELNEEGKTLDEQDYFTIYNNKIIEGEKQILHTITMKQAFIKLCDRTSPAPFFEIDIQKGLLFSTAKGFTLKIQFQDSTSISILSTFIGRQISMIKLILKEKNDLTETETLSYTSLQERYEVFLEMLTMSSMFKVGEPTVDYSSMYHLEIELYKLEYAIHRFKSNINILHKELFPIQNKKLEEAIQFTIANSRHQYKKDTLIFSYYLHYFKPVATSSWEFGEYIQNNTILAFRNVGSITVEPLLNIIDIICYRIVKIIIALFIIYMVVQYIGVFAPMVFQYVIQKI